MGKLMKQFLEQEERIKNSKFEIDKDKVYDKETGQTIKDIEEMTTDEIAEYILGG